MKPPASNIEILNAPGDNFHQQYEVIFDIISPVLDLF